MHDAVLKNFGRIVRYFAAPVVGLATVHCFDASDSVLPALVTIAHTGAPPEPVISWWPLTVFTLVFGTILYHAHRTLFHSWFNRLVVCAVTSINKSKVAARKLDRARAHRENGPAHGSERGYHFLWCSAWSVWLVPISLSPKFPTVSVEAMWREYIGVFLPLVIIALISDVWSTVLDVYAYTEYADYRGDPTPVNGGSGTQEAV